MSNDTLVFIPAWNEEHNLPAVLDELRLEIPDADVLVVDDGSTDRTADVAREHGAEVLSFGENRGLRAGIAAGYAWALEHEYAYCGRVDADGQHPAAELRKLLELVQSDTTDVAVGSRFVSGPGYEPYRYEPEGIRKLGTGLLRRSMRGRARPPLQRRDERPLCGVGEGVCPRSRARTRAAPRRSRRYCASTTRACASRRCRSTCASARAASRS